jgi:hypothetical protein
MLEAERFLTALQIKILKTTLNENSKFGAVFE